MEISSIFGWTGMILFLLSYALLSAKKVDSQGTIYQLMNLAAAAFVGVNVFVHRAWPVFVLEIFWGGIALWTLIKKK